MLYPPWCVDGLAAPRAGDLLIAARGAAVVHLYLRRGHTPHTVFAVPKYVEAADAAGPWSFAGRPLRRVLDAYTARGAVRALQAAPGSVAYSPLFGADVAELHLGHGLVVCSSLLCADHLVRAAPWAPQVEAYRELLVALGARGVEPSCLRPTGSLLLGSTHRGSDLDVVIVGFECAARVLEVAREVLEPARLPDRAFAERVAREARLRGVPYQHLARTLPRWIRVRVRGVEVSLSFADDVLRGSPERRVLVVGGRVVRTKIELDALEPGLLDYPALAWLSRGSFDVLVLLDTLYVPSLLEGGCFTVRGGEAVLRIGADELRALVVGAREHGTTYVVRGC